MITALSKVLIYYWLNSPLRRLWFQWRYKLLTGVFKQTATVDAYLALNDPYSYILVQMLADLEQRFNVSFKLYLVYENTPLPQAGKLARQWAIKDANQLASLYQLTPITEQPAANTLITGQQTWYLQPKTIANAWQVFEAVWKNKYQKDEHYAPSTPVINAQIKNQARQKRKGHYQSASLYFYGMWFAGIERLAHFERVLIQHQLATTANATYSKTRLQFSTLPIVNRDELSSSKKLIKRDNELCVYVAINSLYSYLGWCQAKQLSQHYQLPITVKIILPFAMQGVVLPVEKRCYALFDGYREAESKGITLTNFADLTREDINLCYRLFQFSAQAGKANEYIDAVFQAIFVKKTDASLHKQLGHIYQTLNLDYQAALRYNQNHDWQQITDRNQQALSALGLWGVPCFHYQNTACWGQDKLWQIEREILAKLIDG